MRRVSRVVSKAKPILPMNRVPRAVQLPWKNMVSQSAAGFKAKGVDCEGIFACSGQGWAATGRASIGPRRPGMAEFGAAHRLFSSTQKSQAAGGEKDDEGTKRMASDDPSQLPAHFFTPVEMQSPKRLGLFARLFLAVNMPLLQRMTKGEFVPEDFLEGSKVAFDQIMGGFTRGSLEGFDPLMTSRVLGAFRASLDDYRKHGVQTDYESLPVHTAEIMRVQFVREADTKEILVWIDVQFVNQQRVTLRDSTGKTIGVEGEWVEKPTVWRFQSPMDELQWVLEDMP